MNEAYENLLTRRSCRAYRKEQIKEEELDAILKAGTYAPTSMGKQSPVIVAVQDPAMVATLDRLNAGVMGMEDGHPFYGAPTVLVVFSRDDHLGDADGNLVIGNLLNAAHILGVDSCYIWRAREVFQTEEGRALMVQWEIPEEYAAIGNVILGYGLPEGKREAPPRKEGYIRKI